jgi:hypothetical protein
MPKNLSSIYELKEANPFETLKIMNLDYSIINSAKGSSRNKAKALLYDIETFGLAKALKIHRKGKNNISTNKYLIPFNGIDLHLAHQNRMKSFFGENFKVLKSIVKN